MSGFCWEQYFKIRMKWNCGVLFFVKPNFIILSKKHFQFFVKLTMNVMKLNLSVKLGNTNIFVKLDKYLHMYIIRYKIPCKNVPSLHSSVFLFRKKNREINWFCAWAVNYFHEIFKWKKNSAQCVKYFVKPILQIVMSILKTVTFTKFLPKMRESKFP